MATAPRLGLTPAKTVGSGPDNKGLTEYTIANGYATALGTGDPVKLTTDGSIIRASNSADTIGVFHGVTYVDSTGRIQIQKYWPASTTSLVTPVTALVMDNPTASYFAVCASPVAITTNGDLYPMNLTAPNSSTGRSQMTVNNTPTKTGSLAVTGTNNAALTGLTNGAAFNISSSVAATVTTITIVTNQTPAQLLALLNAVPGITASLNASNFLVVATTDGGKLVLADGTSTPLASSNLLAVAGTYAATVSAGSDMVKVLKVIDTVNNVVEVKLSEHSLEGRGAN